MRKQEELNILDGAIQQLGMDSYIGPWLSEVRASVEHDIRSDYFPMASRKQSQELCDRMIADATEKANGIIQRAEIEAKKKRDHADHYFDAVCNTIQNSLHQLRSL